MQETSWILDLGLDSSDEKILLSSTSWLTDTIINAAQTLLKNKYPAVRGLQDVSHGLNMSFSIERGEFVQILHDGLNQFKRLEFIILKWIFTTVNTERFPQL